MLFFFFFFFSSRRRHTRLQGDWSSDVCSSDLVFPPVFHWILIAFLAVGEFPLNTVVFRLFGEAEYMTYIMASTLALIIPLIGVFIGVHLRHAIPRRVGNVLIGVLTPLVVAATLYAVSLLRNTYITSQMSST